jgi:prepilin-type N-terminal cleavage/methylation domain-containing protein/prepilin-type processing-associated H-X9-DG protein
MSSSASRSVRGFTLVECLVVLAIIVVIAGLLFPVLLAAKGRSREVAAISELSQIGKATALYAQDFDDRLPFASGNNCFHLATDVGRSCSDLPLEAIRNSRPVNQVIRAYGCPWEVFKSPCDRMSEVLLEEPGHKPTWFEETTTRLYPGSSYEFTRRGLKSFSLSSYVRPSEGIVFQSLYQLDEGPARMTHVLFADWHVKLVPNLTASTGDSDQ